MSTRRYEAVERMEEKTWLGVYVLSDNERVVGCLCKRTSDRWYVRDGVREQIIEHTEKYQLVPRKLNDGIDPKDIKPGEIEKKTSKMSFDSYNLNKPEEVSNYLGVLNNVCKLRSESDKKRKGRGS